MIYATLQHRKEDESALYPLRDFVKIDFNGNGSVLNELNKLFTTAENLLKEVAVAELKILAERKKEANKNIVNAIKSRKGVSDAISKARNAWQEYSTATNYYKGINKVEYEVETARDILAELGFKQCHTSFTPDRIAVAEFSYEGKQEDLEEKVQELLTHYQRLKESHLLGLNLQYGVSTAQEEQVSE